LLVRTEGLFYLGKLPGSREDGNDGENKTDTYASLFSDACLLKLLEWELPLQQSSAQLGRFRGKPHELVGLALSPLLVVSLSVNSRTTRWSEWSFLTLGVDVAGSAGRSVARCWAAIGCRAISTQPSHRGCFCNVPAQCGACEHVKGPSSPLLTWTGPLGVLLLGDDSKNSHCPVFAPDTGR